MLTESALKELEATMAVGRVRVTPTRQVGTSLQKKVGTPEDGSNSGTHGLKTRTSVTRVYSISEFYVIRYANLMHKYKFGELLHLLERSMYAAISI